MQTTTLTNRITRLAANPLRITAGMALVAMLGCAGSPPPPSTADLMRGHADAGQGELRVQRELAKQWEDGNKLVNSGTRRLSDGEQRIRNAESELERGQQQAERGRKEIAEGKTMVEDSERRFRDVFPALDIETTN